jgi:hypothetical protein
LSGLKFLVEAIYLTLGVNNALLTSEKGMAFKTYICADLFMC